MRAALFAAALVAAVAMPGCVESRQPAGDATPPVGRYQFISKEKYQDGTIEYACLDTATGQIGYATIYPDADQQRRSLTNFDCSN